MNLENHARGAGKGVTIAKNGKIVIKKNGGDLQIEWRESDNRIYMTGPAARVYDGTYKVA